MFETKYKIRTISEDNDQYCQIYHRKWWHLLYTFTGINCRNFGDASDIIQMIKAEE